MRTIVLLLLLTPGIIQAFSQGFEPNYDESQVPFYTLPNPLVCFDGTKVKSVKKWEEVRRPEILKFFSKNVYGITPPYIFPEISYKIISEDRAALDGKAIRKEVLVEFDKKYPEFNLTILIYLPSHHIGSVPLFLATNIFGNHVISDDPGITLTSKWIRNSSKAKVVNNRATEASRGIRSYRWPIERIIERGYGVATYYSGDLDRDTCDGYSYGIQKLFAEEGQNEPQPDEWAVLGAWAWGLSRCMDYFETDDEIDHTKVAVFGHSRTGKAALWAGAQDERFAVVISNDSGCGGAAISRRQFGETIGCITGHSPHWFCANLKKFGDNIGNMPVDQHMLVALIAPRPVYIASADKDRWADPKGEFLSAKHAGPVYSLFGLKGLGVEAMPEVNQPVFNQIGYHVREGGHDILPFDWECFMNFTDYHFSNPNRENHSGR